MGAAAKRGTNRRSAAPGAAAPETLWMRDEETRTGFRLGDAISAVALSPTGKHFVICGAAEWHHNGGDIGLYSIEDRMWRAMLRKGGRYHGEASGACFSPDGKLVFVGTYEYSGKELVTAWSTRGGKKRWSVPAKPAKGDASSNELASALRLAISGNGKVLAAVSNRWERLLIIDTRTGKVTRSVSVPGVRCVALDARGERVALGTRDSSVMVLGLRPTIKTDTFAWQHASGEGLVSALAWSPDGRALFAQYKGRTERLYAVDKPAPASTKRREMSSGLATGTLSYGAAGPRVLRTDKAGAVATDFKSGKVLVRFKSLDVGWRAAFSPDGVQLLVTSPMGAWLHTL